MMSLECQDVVVHLGYTLLRDGFLTAHRIYRDRTSPNIAHAQQLRNSGDFMGFCIRGALPQDQLVLGRPVTGQMHRGFVVGMIVRPNQRFPINGNHLPLRDLLERGNPGHETALELFRVQQGKDSSKGVMGRNTRGQFQKRAKKRPFGIPPCFDFPPTIGPTDYAADSL
jgi:hypothetical protein